MAETEITPEELDALTEESGAEGPVAKGGEVRPRDFRQPRRLSRERLAEIRQGLARAVPRIETDLRARLRKCGGVDVVDVGEIGAAGLFHDLDEPFVLLCFEVGGAQGWVVWENRAALAAAEVALGGEPAEEIEARKLSGIESRIVKELLLEVLREITAEVGSAPADAEVVQDARRFLLALDPGLDRDPQRLFIHLGIDCPGGESTLRVYLPGVLPPAKPRDEGAEAVTVPGHLDEIPLQLSAQLGSLDVELGEVLGLEVGDVIPLDLTAHDPLRLFVEERPCGTARWGSHKGQLAVQVIEFRPEQEE